MVNAGGTILGEAVVGANGVYTVMLNIPVIPNSVNFFTVRARAVDQAGNVSPLSAGYNLTIDTRIPPTPRRLALSPLDDSGIPGDNITNVRQPTLVGRTGRRTCCWSTCCWSAPSSSTTLVGGVRTAADGSFQVRFPAALADGTYRVQARAYDAAGNQSFSPILTLTIDTTAPAAVPSLAAGRRPATPGSGATAAPASAARCWSARSGPTAEPGTRVEVIDPAGNVLNLPAATAIQPDGSFATQLASDLVNGTIVLRARLRDAAGNAGPAGATLTLTIVTTDGDYDADGRADLAVYQRTAAAPVVGQWSIARSSLGTQVAALRRQHRHPAAGRLRRRRDRRPGRPSASRRPTWFILGLAGHGPGDAVRPGRAEPAGAGGLRRRRHHRPRRLPAEHRADGAVDLVRPELARRRRRG